MIKDYKVSIAIPIALLILSILLIGFKGIPKSIDITGGTEITIKVNENMDITPLKESLNGIAEVKKLESADGYYIVIRCKNEDVDIVKQKIKEFFHVDSLDKLNYSEKTIGATLSSKFFEEGFKAVGFAFMFMAIVVYLYFRNPVPSGAIILSALSDIIMALGAMSLLGIELSSATIAALLMVIGYSVDSDILLTTRVLKRLTKSFDETVKEAMKTGLTMTLTTITAMLILLIVVKLFIPVADILANIATVLILALIADIINTWLLNAGILKYYITEYRAKKI
ncbi:TPA: protein translocase subunit SecF [Methanocaldococcus jannaschii]|uniref:Protein-export membrane protein SecF n=2 Tax=Methanocaldococcus jannaschii TaxID=2190 RepID=SECF_METJA|nr:protein translocase subunit SecF [Methanocaldococcus jannaschii]Q58650.1 RecName: Full=Protein-export membrane protein SecF [Methanocaldococcus jannaschii DSM 2661]AAB99256.1 protein translocase, subunit SECF (secF) [Methanocaldococcus jannaschii DSM 2661]HII60013.1 protein translocase subunit SecF [Methanocaldococcus jannaschii]